MMTSLIFAFLGYVLMAAVSILDKFILTESVKETSIYSFYSTIFFLGAFMFLPFCVPVQSSHLWWFIGSGIAFGLGLWTMFIALEQGEVSHIMPFSGAVVAIATYALSSLVLGEVLSNSAQVGLWLLVGACLLLSFEKSKKHNGFHRGFFWAIISGLLFGISHVMAKYIYDIYPFITSLVWTKGTVGIIGVIIFCIPSVRKELFATKKKIQSKAEKNSLVIVSVNKVLGILGVVAIQYAIALGSVTVVNALAGVEYALMFVVIYLFTKIKPKVFSEYFTRREIVVEVCAILLTIIGLLYLSY